MSNETDTAALSPEEQIGKYIQANFPNMLYILMTVKRSPNPWAAPDGGYISNIKRDYRLGIIKHITKQMKD